MAGQQLASPKLQAQGIKPSRSERDQLTDMCASFLKIRIPSGNIISVGKFTKFAPLFNKEAVSKMTENMQKKLYDEYRRTFSLQHPIKIYGNAVDPDETKVEVIYVEDDDMYHEVVYTIPPMFRQIKTLNELGSDTAATLINSFLNTAVKSDNPIAQAEFEKYGFVIGKLLTDLNPPDKDAEKQFQDAEQKLVNNDEESSEGAPKNSQSTDDAMTDLFDW